MAAIRELAEQLDAGEATLRRGVRQGLIQAERRGPRRLAISPRERTYLGRHWPLLSRLRRTLRTERNVRMAVLIGSVARGSERPDSDIDMLVDLRDPHFARLAELSRTLSRVAGREVQLIRLGDAERDAPLLADALSEGRVLIDREARWPRLKARQASIQRRAARAEADLARRAREAVEYLRRNP